MNDEVCFNAATDAVRVYRDNPKARRALKQISARAATIALRKMERMNVDGEGVEEELNVYKQHAHDVLMKCETNPLWRPPQSSSKS